jgi:hypothetical protein
VRLHIDQPPRARDRRVIWRLPELVQAAVCSGAPATDDGCNACGSGCFWFLPSGYVPAAFQLCGSRPSTPTLQSSSKHCGASADCARHSQLHEPLIRPNCATLREGLLSAIFHAGFRLSPVDEGHYSHATLIRAQLVRQLGSVVSYLRVILRAF